MEESFRGRVEKIFGSLAPSASTPWSLTDDEVERRRWKLQEKDTSARDETPCSSSFYDFSKKDGNEWEIRSSIGMDNTLDNEEEEDEFDKVASGRENADERLYMNDVTNRGSYLNMHNVLPNSINGTKDPRANHHSARIRLKEDEVEAQKMNFPHPGSGTAVKESHARLSEYGGQRKSILKRKNNIADSKPQKRVRFDPGCKIDGEKASEEFEYSSFSTSSMNPTDSDDGSQLAYNASRIPDYLLNPSKYTRYSFDSLSEHDEESNTCMDLLKLVKSSKAKELAPELENASGNLPKSVTFIPKKRSGEAKAAEISNEIKGNKEDYGELSLPRAGFPVGIAAGESQHSEAIALDGTEPETNAATEDSSCFKKPSRNYRVQSRSDDSDS
ncbi:hypothetical protein Patl1_05410 [Pistacia atlantica]|uniref:Uncharacterized protein n=1 Tax=Pistacia atlantica TaxID=434234 RepID=A0ACC1BVV0_9ROSI|nr:hypothetical protein Patl1_05410 [Pistacia atlantica]